jgi:hypothetical protein
MKTEQKPATEEKLQKLLMKIRERGGPCGGGYFIERDNVCIDLLHNHVELNKEQWRKRALTQEHQAIENALKDHLRIGSPEMVLLFKVMQTEKDNKTVEKAMGKIGKCSTKKQEREKMNKMH